MALGYQFPMRFSASVVSDTGAVDQPDSPRRLWSAAADSDPSQRLTCSIPTEFNGPGGGLSPEDLYALAAANCFVATFKVFAEKSQAAYRAVTVKVLLEVDVNENGQPWMARLGFNVLVSGVKQPDRMGRILQKVSQSCFVLNSVKSEKSFSFEIADS